MDEPERKREGVSDAGIAPQAEADAVLQESAKLAEATRERRRQAKRDAGAETVFELKDVAVMYGGSYAVQGVNMAIARTRSRRSSARPGAARARSCAASTA